MMVHGNVLPDLSSALSCELFACEALWGCGTTTVFVLF